METLMAATWPLSRVPFLDENGDPMVGAQLRFYDAGTSTPQVVYADSALSNALAQPIPADARGMFPVVFLNSTPGSYRQNMLEADGTLVFDDDGIDVAQAATFTPPDAGDTDPSLLFKTGMLQNYYGEIAPTGWVRGNGRTIGSATSGATERANADCQSLFLFLWTADASLVVSTGRGGTAAGDWAANKNIALPDFRGRALVGLDTMGASAAGILTGIDTIGETAGAEGVTLDLTQIPAHAHGNGTLKMPNHGHPARFSTSNDSTSSGSGGIMVRSANLSDQPAYTGVPSSTVGQQIGGSGEVAVTGAMANAGGGLSHSNVQPSKGVTIIVKL